MLSKDQVNVEDLLDEVQRLKKMRASRELGTREKKDCENRKKRTGNIRGTDQ
ncbi:MAG: hypothetical protein ACQEWC_03350 [Bacillota bacterium]